MKKGRLLTILLCMALMSSFILVSCANKPSDLESFLNSNSDVKDQIDSAASTAGMTVEVKGNDVIYTYDLSGIDGVDEEMIKDEAMVSTLQSSLDGMSSTFVGLCKQLEDQTKFSDIKMIVNFTYGDEVLVTQTFTATE